MKLTKKKEKSLHKRLMQSLGYKPRMGRVFKCEHCGELTYKLPFHVRNSKHHFCSRKCYGISKINKIDKKWLTADWYKKIKDRNNDKNPNWKGNVAKYGAIHLWVKRHIDFKKVCSLCNTANATIYDLSNKNHNYKRNLEEWWILCRSCHMAYDIKMGFRNNNFERFY